jgi:hypothetical protein
MLLLRVKKMEIGHQFPAVITIFGTEKSSSHEFTISVSNFNYGMSITPVNPGRNS